MRRQPTTAGFTLIELLIAVLIIGILAAIALPAFNKQRERAKDSAAQQGLEASLRAAKAVYAEGETFPSAGLATLLGRAERSQSFADSTAFPAAGANTINVQRASASRVILRSTSASGNQHMLALDEPDSRVLRYSPGAEASGGGTLPTYTNLHTNPSADTNLSQWHPWAGSVSGTSNMTRSYTRPRCGGAGVEVSTTTDASSPSSSLWSPDSNLIPVVAGERYQVRASVYLVSTTGAAPTLLRLSGRFTDGSSTVSGIWAEQISNPQLGRWYDMAGIVTVPSSVTHIQAETWITHGASTTLVFRADCFSIVNLGSGPAPRSYFDGDSPAASWTGSAHASTSSGPAGSSSW